MQETGLFSDVSVVIPCLNEEKTIGKCIVEAMSAMPGSEIIVANNRSTDKSREIAKKHGAKVVEVIKRGYGNTLCVGIQSAKGTFIVMADADESYDFGDGPKIVEELRAGADLVVGNRFEGGIEKGAMPFLHRWIGNPVLSFIGRLLFNAPLHDFHCGIRGVRRSKIASMHYVSGGMEWASEMIVRSAIEGWTIKETPAKLRRDGRDRAPHLRTWRDGWRHLKLLLMMAPDWLYILPGTIAITIGTLLSVVLLLTPVNIGEATLDIHTLLYSSFLAVAGVQIFMLGHFAKSVARVTGIIPGKEKPMEWWLIAGVVFGALSLIFFGWNIYEWFKTGLNVLDPIRTMRLAIPAVALAMTAGQLVFGAFLDGLITMAGEGIKLKSGNSASLSR